MDKPQARSYNANAALGGVLELSALEPFVQMVCALFASLKRWLHIRCVRYQRMGKDESELLVILAAVLRELPQAVDLRLCHLMQRIATSAAQEMMHVIADTGLYLRQAKAILPRTGHRTIRTPR